MIRRMNRLFSAFFIILVLAILLLVNGLVLVDLQDISRASPLFQGKVGSFYQLDGRQVIRIGVVSRFAPNIIYAGYQPIMDYLNRNGSFAYELRLSTSYQDAVDRLRDREVTASFLGAWITSGLEADSDLMPMLAPLNEQGTSEFHSVLITGPGSGVSSLDQLSGRRVALPSRLSWSGNWLKNSGLAEVGLSLADLDSVHHFDHHQTVVWQVLRGNFDAGVVKESVAEKYRKEGLQFVARSGPIPGPPLVGNRRGTTAALDEITALLLALDPADPEDRRVLNSWTPEFSFGFTPVAQGHYSRAFADHRERP
jgi:phosphonate transport system substrate-binding protein